MRRATVLLISLLLLVSLSGCDGSRAVRPSESAAGMPSHVSVALGQLGAPYRFGGEQPSGFDCSGLVYYSFRESGLRIPRSTVEQHRAARPVSMDRARPGDLLFFKLGGKLSHVGLYMGSRRFVHAPSSGKRVEVASLDDSYWRRRFVGAGRIH